MLVCRNWKRTLDPLKLESQMVLSHHVAMWLLETEPKSSS